MMLRPCILTLRRQCRQTILWQFQRSAHDSSADDRDLDHPKGIHLNLLNDPNDGYSHLYINKYSNKGFSLSNGLELAGPMVFFPRSFVSWKIKDSREINEDSLSLFKALYPKLDVLIIGKGSAKAAISDSVIKFLRLNKINFEILPTEKAIPTFNFMSAEQRWVAAALIPPEQIVDSLSKEIQQQMLEADLKARLHDEEEDLDDIMALGDAPGKEIKGYDERFIEAVNPDRKEKNIFGYKIDYNVYDPLAYGKPLKEDRVFVNRKQSADDSDIRVVRKSDIEKKKRDIENIVIARSPLDTVSPLSGESKSSEGKIVRKRAREEETGQKSSKEKEKSDKD